jgi:hypothetical protein
MRASGRSAGETGGKSARRESGDERSVATRLSERTEALPSVKRASRRAKRPTPHEQMNPAHALVPRGGALVTRLSRGEVSSSRSARRECRVLARQRRAEVVVGRPSGQHLSPREETPSGKGPSVLDSGLSRSDLQRRAPSCDPPRLALRSRPCHPAVSHADSPLAIEPNRKAPHLNALVPRLVIRGEDRWRCVHGHGGWAPGRA